MAFNLVNLEEIVTNLKILPAREDCFLGVLVAPTTIILILEEPLHTETYISVFQKLETTPNGKILQSVIDVRRRTTPLKSFI